MVSEPRQIKALRSATTSAISSNNSLFITPLSHTLEEPGRTDRSVESRSLSGLESGCFWNTSLARKRDIVEDEAFLLWPCGRIQACSHRTGVVVRRCLWDLEVEAVPVPVAAKV